jgi:hypothetical protein
MLAPSGTQPAQDIAPRPRGSRLLPSQLAEHEPPWKRRVFELIAFGIVAGFFHFLLCYWTPASGGVDQNGYLVGGKRLALSGSSGVRPANPFQYIGGMWVIAGDTKTDDVWFYPKYPIGLPLLNAIPLWFDWENGKVWAFYISPACTALALLAMFLMTRALAGSFAGILAMLLLGTNYTALLLANMPWSHGPALFFVTWGMYMLLRWWQTGAIWRGIVAGFLLGYAVTVRYTEGLLLFPLLFAALLTIRWRERSTYLRGIVPLAAWAVPVLWLVTFNWFAMGSITGYDTTNESTGFTFERLKDQWETMLKQFYDSGVFFVLPLTVLGLATMWRQSWRAALLILLWLLPGVVLYTSYYWGSGRMGVWYLRFFLTLFPPMILAAMWYVTAGKDRGRSIAAPIAAGIVVAFTSAIGLRNALPVLERDLVSNSNLEYTAQTILERAPAGSVLLADQRGWISGLLNFIQWRGDYELYSTQAFRWRPNWQGEPSADHPTPLQPARQVWLRNRVYNSATPADLMRMQGEIIDAAIDQGRRVFLVQAVDWSSAFRLQFGTGDQFQTKPVARWKELATARPSEPRPFMPPHMGFPSRQAQTWQLYEIVRRSRDGGGKTASTSHDQPPATTATAPGS